MEPKGSRWGEVRTGEQLGRSAKRSQEFKWLQCPLCENGAWHELKLGVTAHRRSAKGYCEACWKATRTPKVTTQPWESRLCFAPLPEEAEGPAKEVVTEPTPTAESVAVKERTKPKKKKKKRPSPPEGYRRRDKLGYVHLLLPVNDPWVKVLGTRSITEHRYVMMKKLNRPLRPGESVHHRNGKRDDNRIENLEHWIDALYLRSQNSGQRLKDVITDYFDEIDPLEARDVLSRTRHATALAAIEPGPESAAFFLAYV